MPTTFCTKALQEPEETTKLIGVWVATSVPAAGEVEVTVPTGSVLQWFDWPPTTRFAAVIVAVAAETD